MARPSFRKDDGGGQAVRGQGANYDVVRQAFERLSEYEHFRVHTKSISFEFSDGVLTAAGTLPSFYLKQVLQTVLRDVPGVVRIVNRVKVEAWPSARGGNSSPARNGQK